MKIVMEFRHSHNLQLSPVVLGGMYQLILFGFNVTIFRIMESRCSLFFVTFILFTLQYDIVKILMEFPNSNHLELTE